MTAFLGVDAGGSHTRAVLVSQDGQVLGAGLSGPGNFRTVSFDVARRSVSEAAAAAMSECDRSLEVAAAFIGSAGLEEPGSEQLARELLGDSVSASRVFLDSDVYIAWAGAFECRPGILVSAGTGSICLAVTADGTRIRVGGWGPLFGDEGSAFAIAREAIAAALATLDGRTEARGLLEELLSFAGQSSSQGNLASYLTAWLYHHERKPGEIAAFAPRVEKAAQRGDSEAHGILARAGVSLARLAIAAAQQAADIGPHTAEGGPFQVSCSGAVLLSNGSVRESFDRTLWELPQPPQVVEAALPPEFGAVLLAMDLAGFPRSTQLMERLRREVRRHYGPTVGRDAR